MWVLTSAYCSVTKEKLHARDIYHMPGDGPVPLDSATLDTYCRCHNKKVLHDKPEVADAARGR